MTPLERIVATVALLVIGVFIIDLTERLFLVLRLRLAIYKAKRLCRKVMHEAGITEEDLK